MPQFGGKDSKRHFTVVMGGKEHGLYVSSTPSSAAKMAVTKLCAANKSKKVEFHIREITQGSKKKTYGPYDGHIEKLKEPIELKGRVIKYKPVAKLSGKTGAKKGGMRGGAKIYECYTKIPGTEYTFKIQKLNFVNDVYGNEYVLTLINNQFKNSKKDLETLENDFFTAMIEGRMVKTFSTFLNEQNINFSVTFYDHNRSIDSIGLLYRFLSLYGCTSTQKIKIEDNIIFVDPHGKEYKAEDNVNIDRWIGLIAEWFLTPTPRIYRIYKNLDI